MNSQNKSLSQSFENLLDEPSYGLLQVCVIFFYYYSEPFIERKKILLYHKYPLNHGHSGTIDVILKQLFAIENTLTCKFSMLLISIPPCELFQTY